MSSISTRHRLEYSVLRSVSALFRLMPVNTTTWLAGTTWRRLAPWLAKKRHERALANLRIAFPHTSDAERLRICLAHWENLGRVFAETLQIDRLIKDSSRFEITNADIMRRYRGKLGPAIGVTLHMGNWELAIWPLLVIGANPGAIYRSVKNPLVDRYLRSLRRQLYPGGLFGRGTVEGELGDDHRTARLITNYLRNGGRLGIVCDQFYRRGIPLPLFGKRTPTQPIAAIVARRLGVRLWIACCIRIGRESRFRIEIKELKVPRTASPANDIRAILTSILGQYEVWIRERPDQWMWSNRVWG